MSLWHVNNLKYGQNDKRYNANRVLKDLARTTSFFVACEYGAGATQCKSDTNPIIYRMKLFVYRHWRFVYCAEQFVYITATEHDCRVFLWNVKLIKLGKYERPESESLPYDIGNWLLIACMQLNSHIPTIFSFVKA